MIRTIKMALAYICLLLTCFVGFIWTLFRPFNPEVLMPVGRVSGFLGSLFLGVKIKVEGREIFEENRPAIIVSNHQDNIDVFVIGASYPKRTVSVGKQVLKWIPFFGQFYWLSGNILIDRSNKRKALQSMNLAAKRVREKDTSVWIMPEGTRSQGRGLGDFKKGAYHLAIAGELPIIPVSFSSFHKFNNLNKFKSGTILVKVHEPIQTTGKTRADIDEILTESRNSIQAGIDELDARLEKDLTKAAPTPITI